MAALGQAAQPPWVSSNAAGCELMEEVPAESGLLVPVVGASRPWATSSHIWPGNPCSRVRASHTEIRDRH